MGILSGVSVAAQAVAAADRASERLLRDGDVIELTAQHRVYAEIPKHFAHAKHGDFSLTRAEASLGRDDLAYLRGRYVVVKTTHDGGGQSHDGGFPDGHHVWCESVDRKYKVDFYQTGCFTAMIPEITPIGRATLRWVVE